MSQSLVQIYVHVVFSTKHRKPFLNDDDFRDRTHHRQETFQDELRRLCRKYGIDIDERYAWD